MFVLPVTRARRLSESTLRLSDPRPANWPSELKASRKMGSSRSLRIGETIVMNRHRKSSSSRKFHAASPELRDDDRDRSWGCLEPMTLPHDQRRRWRSGWFGGGFARHFRSAKVVYRCAQGTGCDGDWNPFDLDQRTTPRTEPRSNRGQPRARAKGDLCTATARATRWMREKIASAMPGSIRRSRGRSVHRTVAQQEALTLIRATAI